MAEYRDYLPQIDGDFFTTDGGLKTTLVFHDGINLPHFAAFDLMKPKDGRQRLHEYFDPYIGIAWEAGAGFILESPTWRANTDWGQRLGYSASTLEEANRDAHEGNLPIVVSGCIGPRGDGYDPGDAMAPIEAKTYHS